VDSKSDQRLYVATSLADGVAALKERGAQGAPLAGATWIMRAPLRRERLDLSYVALSRIDDLRRVTVDERHIGIGACVTHAELARALADEPGCRALAIAAGKSANPAIREVATIGGNLCTFAFAASDLVPAMLCLDAEVELETPAGTERVGVDRFLKLRSKLEPGCLLRRILVPRTHGRSAHIRLPLRKAGDYPVAIVSVAVTMRAGGHVDRAVVAVGSVEAQARRWEHLEVGIAGGPLDPQRAASLAQQHSGDFDGRDGVEAPGWYREKVLPTLVRRAIEDIQAQV
jgi:carbon-monoxide dehydrogenase medium subunit